ncbi:MAG: hypothetical protein GY811_03270 [Myxococcales bacterium]|nr:hypothetical protein [Myxococcales bacterium]
MKPTTIIAPLLVACLACNSKPAAEAPAAEAPVADSLHTRKLTLRTYQVPGDRTEEMQRIIETLSYPITIVSANGAQTQFVPLSNVLFTSDGSFIVNAPQEIHDGLPAVIEAVKRSEPKTISMVRVDYWLVVGRPASETNVDPSLAPIADALNSVAEKTGPMDFVRFETMQLQAIEGKWAQGRGLHTQIKQKATVENGKVVLQFEIETGDKGRIETELRLAAGQIAVLGQVGHNTEPQVSPEPVFYIAKAEILK